MSAGRIIGWIVARLAAWAATRSRAEMALISFLLVLAIGYVDLITGKDVTLSFFYVLPIGLAAWYAGSLYAVGLSFLSVAVWLAGDMAAGKKFASSLVFLWNGSVRLAFYIFMVVLLVRLARLQRGLERRVEERAQALTREIAERERLERDLLEVSEREQRRIGRDLHDGLCQHLTGTALAGHVLAEKLAERGLPESSDSRRIVDYVEEAISLARGMAKGLHPVEMEADGLMQALDEFAATTSEMFGIDCRFECDSPVLVPVPATASHLFRIAQEAVGNAIKHGEASKIVLSLETHETDFRLSIVDNGRGFDSASLHGGGMGLRIMADRAKMIGAALAIARGASGGTEIAVVVPSDDLTAAVAHG